MYGYGYRYSARPNVLAFNPLTDIDGLSLYLNKNTNVNTKVAADFVAANSEYLSSASTDFDKTDSDFTFGCWVYFDSSEVTTNTRYIIQKLETVGQYSYALTYIPGGSDNFRMIVSGDGTATTTLNSTFNAPVSNWYFVTCVHDSVNDLIKISVNGNDFETTTFSGGVFLSTDSLKFGTTLAAPTTNGITGNIDAPFFYDKALTLAEVKSLYNSDNGVDYPSLTDLNGTQYAIAQSFQNANSNYFSSASTDYNIGNNDVTFFGWFKVDDSTANNQLLGKWGVSGEYSFNLDIISAIPNKVRFGHSQNGTAAGSLASLNNVSSNTWFFVTCGYDTTLNQVFIEINDLTRYSSANNTGLYNSCPNDFVIGRTFPTGTTSNSSCAQFGMYNRLISTDEQTALYNGGAGVLPSDFTAGQLSGLVSLYGMDAVEGANETDLITASANNLTPNSAPINTTGNITNTTIATIESSLVEWWRLNETSGNRSGELGHTLTDNNTVGYALGKVQEVTETGELVWNWIDQSSNAYVFQNDTVTKQPLLSANSVDFDGTDDSLDKTIADAYSGDSSGIIFFSGYFDNTSTSYFLTSADTAGIDNYFNIGTTPTGEIFIQNKDGATNSLIKSTNTITNGAYFYGYIKSTGTVYEINLNGVNESKIVVVGNDNGNWFADVLLRDNLIIGKLIRTTTAGSVVKANKLIYSNATLTDSQIAEINNFMSNPDN